MDRTTRHIVLTHIRLRKEGNDYFIQGNCCDILRAYVQSEKGEYEEESVQCISDEIQEFRLTNNIQYSLSYKGKGEQFILTQKWEEAGLRRYQPPLEDTRKIYYRVSDVLKFLGVENG